MSSSACRPPWASAGYTAAVHLGARLTRRLTPEERIRVLRAHSTNVDNLRDGRWHTLLTSAFLTEQPLTPVSAALVAGILGGAEARWGARRTAGLFALGHVGGSLVVYAGLRAARPSAETAAAVDVGVSYGVGAVLGALTAAVPRTWPRRAAAAGLVALGARPVLRGGGTFTDAGHLAALLIGLAAGWTGGDHRMNRSFGTAWIPKRHPHADPNRRTP